MKFKNQEERELFFKSNENLIYSVIARFNRSKNSEDYQDVVQIGRYGLLKAIDDFDESKGYKFSSYAVPVIYSEVYKSDWKTQLVKIHPDTLNSERFMKYIVQNWDILTSGENIPMNNENIAALIKCDIESVEKVFEKQFPSLKLFSETEAPDGTNPTLLNLKSSDPSPESIVCNSIWIEELITKIEELEEPARSYILDNTIGLLSVPQIARKYGVKNYGVISAIRKAGYNPVRRMRYSYPIKLPLSGGSFSQFNVAIKAYIGYKRKIKFNKTANSK